MGQVLMHSIIVHSFMTPALWEKLDKQATGHQHEPVFLTVL
jgi:hypothetical protein